jgi:site-specific DNA-methyltransferase (adenine-specific)
MSNWPEWTSPDGRIRLINADCLEVLPTLTGIDAVVTDPPYGIDYQSSHQFSIEYGKIDGDDKPFDPTPWLNFENVILWGGNNFANRLPVGGWICWDKRLSEAADKILGSPFELAWCSRRKLFRIVRLLHGGAKNADAKNGDVANAKRFHPTQKPVRLMEACLNCFPNAELILDPYAGSYSTAVACIRRERRCIAIEKEPKYFEIGKKRCREEYARTVLFNEQEACA